MPLTCGRPIKRVNGYRLAGYLAALMGLPGLFATYAPSSSDWNGLTPQDGPELGNQQPGGRMPAGPADRASNEVTNHSYITLVRTHRDSHLSQQ